MFVVLLCCIMKLVEYSGVGMPLSWGPRPRGKRRRRYGGIKGKTMNEVGTLAVRGVLPVSPDSDCNSNHHVSASYLSNTSSQDIDFIQDHSDYQWFLDYGYREGGINHHTSILSLPESYEANDLNYYDAFSKNMDANLAEADMESFRTEDIHALLTNLPPMCTDHLSQENNRQGESYASVSGSMMVKFDFDSSMSPHSSSQGEESANSTSMSIYKSELLFSPVKELPVMGTNISVDSLDCDMMLTCQANKENYTIAFEGSVTMYSEDSDYHESDRSDSSGASSAHWPEAMDKQTTNEAKSADASMTQSDSSSFTTWSKLKKRTSDNQLRRHPSGNNNNSANESNNLGLSESTAKSQSMPNLYRKIPKSVMVSNCLKSQSNSSSDTCTVKRKPVKVFDIQHHVHTSVSDMATSVDASNSDPAAKLHPNFNLVKLFMKQKSMSLEGMSTTIDQLSSSENWPGSQSGSSSSSGSKPADPSKAIDMSADLRTYDLIAEEPEDEISGSESVEQLSDSISKLESASNSYERLPININAAYRKRKLKTPTSSEFMNRSMQTSQFSEVTNLKNLKTKSPPVKVVEKSFLNKLKQEGEIQKPVYVLYPNYVLPDLDFLNERHEDIAKVLLVPQAPPPLRTMTKKRPFSCNDLEQLKKKGLGHVKDWESLNFLLPQECRTILTEITDKPLLRQKPKRRPFSCEYTTSSSSSTATQPSSGYRGSSTILTSDSQSPAATLNPLFVYRYDSVTSSEASLCVKSTTTAPPLPTRCVSLQKADRTPPRPPLPRSILRKELKSSLTSEEDLAEEALYKRRIDPYFLRRKRMSETEDEGVDAGASSSSVDEHQESVRTTSPSQPRADYLLANIGAEGLAQLEEFLKISGISTSDTEDLREENLMQLRSYVGKFMALKINQDGVDHFGGKKSVSFGERFNVQPKYLETKLSEAPNNSPNVSAFIQPKNYTRTLVDMPICEESEGSNYPSPQSTPVHKSSNLEGKRYLTNSLTEAVEHLISHFSAATNQSDLSTLGDSGSSPSCAKLALSTLCPALYAVLSDGLKPNLESSFGAIPNSVWQVVEASAQQGPLTKALNELVMRINSEDVLTEGLVKFNAFVFGLLNVRSLDAWVSYLRTRESILKKHYEKDSLMLTAHTGGANVRALLDALIAALQPLALLPFQLDLLFEYRQLHISFQRMDSYKQQMSPAKEATRVKARPRSCVESKPNFRLGDVSDSAKKRWSGISANSKLYLVYDRLAREDDEEYTDSLEAGARQDDGSEDAAPSLCEEGPQSLDSNFTDEKPINGKRFKKLQQKWEMLSGRESGPSPPGSPTGTKSKIPRPITSPNRPSGIPVLASPTSKVAKKVIAKALPKLVAVKKTISTPRTSRVDQLENGSEAVRHVPRPSSLPYKAASSQSAQNTKTTPPRRAASSSLNRKTLNKSSVPKTVRTLSHRLPSESGHLSYNDGERLRVVLEVDDNWLLCCRGTEKGLVPRSAVIADGARF